MFDPAWAALPRTHYRALPKDVLFEVVADTARRDGETADVITKDIGDDEVKTRRRPALQDGLIQ